MAGGLSDRLVVAGVSLSGSPDVACQSLVFGALHGTAFEQTAVVFHSKTVPVGLPHGHQSVGGLELRLGGRHGETVPRAGLLAAVAAVDCVTHDSRGLWRNVASILYREV